MAWYHLLYDIAGGELERAQSFEKEQLLAKSGKPNNIQRIRIVIIVLITGIMLNCVRTQPWINLFIFLTNWAVWAINLTAIIGYVLAASPSCTQKNAPNLHALHHVFYTLSLFLSPVVILVYWTIVFKKHKGEMWEATKEWHGRVLAQEEREALYEQKLHHTYLVHTIPAIGAFVLMLINDTVLVKRQAWYMIFFGFLYGCSNYYSVMYVRKGKPTYWFITWRDIWSPIWAGLITLTFSGLFYLTAMFDEYITGRSTSIPTQSAGKKVKGN